MSSNVCASPERSTLRRSINSHLPVFDWTSAFLKSIEDEPIKEHKQPFSEEEGSPLLDQNHQPSLLVLEHLISNPRWVDVWSVPLYDVHRGDSDYAQMDLNASHLRHQPATRWRTENHLFLIWHIVDPRGFQRSPARYHGRHLERELSEDEQRFEELSPTLLDEETLSPLRITHEVSPDGALY
ncbi:hypothetical protein PIIN_08923 [Serendipita indica DSM 11827]|uniref:Uncharacterized protein n=1 Tax=Serendipita indica (strain DSM 11827) TaxID=1109443 RepID=G4TUF0_SERID|nr:hypothetical protein PIIN_08923 [Serendipita indica DSM 11827]